MRGVKSAVNFGICSHKVSGENGTKLVMKNSGHFRAAFLEKSEAFGFHAWLRVKISRQQFCKPCRDEHCRNSVFVGWGGLGHCLKAGGGGHVQSQHLRSQ